MAPELNDELTALVLDQSRQRLDRLAGGIDALRAGLDAGEAAADVLETMVRDAHTMKGSAAMVGLAPISDVARAVEMRLRAVADGSEPVTADLLDRLGRAVDGVGPLVPAALAGDDVTARASAITARLAAP